MAGTHSRLSASGAPAYCLCPGKPNAERGLTDTTEFFSAEGTAAHEVLADCLETGIRPESFLGNIIEADGFQVEVTPEMVKALTPIVERYENLARGGQLFPEKRVSLESILGPNQFGTTDIGLLRVRDREIIIADLKYGAGVPVKPMTIIYEPDGSVAGYRLNEQIALYALGFWFDFAREFFDPWDHEDITVRLIIEQPRCAEGGGEVSVSLTELLSFGDTLMEAADRTWPLDAARVPGSKQCQFCKRAKTRGGCPERNAWIISMLGLSDDRIDVYQALKDIKLQSPKLLTPEKRAYIAANAPEIRKWLKQVYEMVLDDAIKGRDTPGLVAVVGKAPARTWFSDSTETVAAELEKLLGSKAWKKELISPAQAESAIPDRTFALRIAKHVDKRQATGTALAPVGTKRERARPLTDLLDELD